MVIATIIFFLVLAYLIFLTTGYRFLLLYLTRSKPISRVDQAPPVTLVVPAFNEGKNIARKIEDLIALDYPADKREI